MRRYVARPLGWDEWWDRDPPETMTVIEEERPPRRTGLVDVRGNELFACDDRDPVGFVRQWRRR